MTISEFKNHFKNSLSELYTEPECDFIFSIVIEKLLDYTPIQQKFYAENVLTDEHLQFLKDFIEGLKSGRPYQQVLGETEFYGHIFKVSEHVLIPRPETEELLEIAISSLTKSHAEQEAEVLDIGTGSGIIPIVLKLNFPHFKVESWDISPEALRTAQENTELHHVEIQLENKNYLNQNLSKKYDIIISNPPYIGQEEYGDINDSVKNFEPQIALFSPTNDALIFYKKIAKDAEEYLKKDGWVFLEINQKLGHETLELFENPNFYDAQLLKDISGNDRIVMARKK